MGARSCTAVGAVRDEMGWSKCKERIIKCKLYFAKEIERLKEIRIAKRVYEKVEGNHSGVKK